MALEPGVDRIIVGPLQTNCYIISSGGECIIIDPGAEPARIASHLREKDLRPVSIVSTHGHFDHTGAVKQLRDEFHCRYVIHGADMDMAAQTEEWSMKFTGERCENPGEPDALLPGAELKAGRVSLVAVHTPGHTPGSTSFLLGDAMFTGDTLFKGTIGRMDFGGSEEEMSRTLESLKGMDDGIRIFPGHGPETTLGDEKRNNRFLIDGII